MKKKRINYYLILIIVIMVLGASAIILMNINYKDDKEVKQDNKKSDNNHFNYNYKYILSYDYLTTNYFIYLLENDEIKVVSKEMVYDICGLENCLKPTDEISYEEVEINLSDAALIKARNVISSFFINGDLSEIDLINYNLDYKVSLVLDGIIENNSDKITLVDDIVIKEKEQELMNKNAELIFSHSYNYVADSNNKIVNAIRDHINTIVNKDFDELISYSKEFLNYEQDNNNLGVSLKLNVEYIGEDEISITYTKEGSLGGVLWYNVLGYVYSTSDGSVKEYYEPRKTEAFNAALDSFKESELYQDEYAKEQLLTNYEQVIKSLMFNEGNYYVTKDEVVFLIEGYELGFSSAISKVVEIRISRNNTF